MSENKPPSRDVDALRRSLPFRFGVGAVIFNDQGLVWIGCRLPKPGQDITDYWQMPQGGIDDDEDPEVAVIREVAEETGTDKVEVIAETPDWIDYDLPDDLIGVSWGGKYRGQRQKWYALRFTGTDNDFDLAAHAKPEFSEWRWEELDALPGMIVPFKRTLYKEVVRAFRELPERVRGENQ